MIQNVIIGQPYCEPHIYFGYDETDWEENEKKNTLFTEERYLPRILVQAGIAKSVNEVRKNRPDLVKDLIKYPDFFKIKWGKKFLWIAVGKPSVNRLTDRT